MDSNGYSYSGIVRNTTNLWSEWDEHIYMYIYIHVIHIHGHTYIYKCPHTFWSQLATDSRYQLLMLISIATNMMKYLWVQLYSQSCRRVCFKHIPELGCWNTEKWKLRFIDFEDKTFHFMIGSYNKFFNSQPEWNGMMFPSDHQSFRAIDRHRKQQLWDPVNVYMAVENHNF